MPIVNGSYVYQNLGSDTTNIQKQAFGPNWKPTNKDMSDYSQAAYNYMMKQQEQAYNLELWNLQNEYNSPSSQMKRFQDAGLNPNLIYSQQNTAPDIKAASAPSFQSSGNYNKSQQRRLQAWQNGISTVQALSGLVKNAVDTYDYMNYGAETNRWKMIQSQETALGQKLDNAWEDYLLHGDNMIYGDASRLPYGPKATMYKTQMDIAQKNFEKVKFMVSNLLPAQSDRQKALKALDDYQLQFMQGKYSAVLDIDLGLGDTVNQWARLLLFIALARMM